MYEEQETKVEFDMVTLVPCCSGRAAASVGTATNTAPPMREDRTGAPDTKMRQRVKEQEFMVTTLPVVDVGDTKTAPPRAETEPSTGTMKGPRIAFSARKG